ncbi:hypothetical protein C5N92_09950 [Glaesserella australis]|uniref:Uncharacterized protein n=1 Tax=Glaesserella australis TaxID=2094024 RepID=A0A328BWU1_9PAST|nr:hypothetical protein C5N92_09950 [Glaesserella australis]
MRGEKLSPRVILSFVSLLYKSADFSVKKYTLNLKLKGIKMYIVVVEYKKHNHVILETLIFYNPLKY